MRVLGRRARFLLTPLVATAVAAQRLVAQSPARIVSYDVVASAPISAVVPTPYLDLGAGATDAETFGWIVAVRRQASGRIAVATADPIQIRLFEPRGRLIGQFGRKGAGPGEYLDVSDLLVLPGDSLLVFDAMQRRLTTLGPDGGVGSTLRTEPPFASSPFDVWLRPLADGTLLIGFAEVTTHTPRPQAITVLQHVGRYDRNGVRRDSLGLFFRGEYFLQATPRHIGGGSAFWDRAFGRRGVLAVDGRSFWASDASTFEVRRFDLRGHLLERHRMDIQNPPLTPAMVSRYRSDELARAPVPDRAVEIRRLAEMPFPAHLPAFRELLIDDRGRLWLQQYIYPQPGPNRWWILDPTSRRARNVVLPDRFTPHLVGPDDIVGVWKDADDVEHVRAYRLAF